VVLVTESEMAAAILATLNAAIAPSVAYEYGKVPGSNGNAGTEPAKYLLIDVTRRYVDSHRASGVTSLTGYRLGTRYVAKSIGDAREMRRRTATALEDQILATADGELGPFTFEAADSLVLTEGYHVGTDTWTF
jgi:hypothetical protein